MSNFFILIAGGFGLLFLTMIALAYRVFTLERRLNRFFKNGEKDLEQLLSNQVEQTERQEKQINQALDRIGRLEEISNLTFQKSGLVRFNPFKQTGSDQSFSIALLDSRDNGFVITSLYGREENRVYGKPVEQGESNYSLTEEEQRAIEKASKRQTDNKNEQQ